MAAGALVMGHETLQTSYAIKDVLPRLGVAAIAVNASLAISGQMVNVANVLASGLLGNGVDPEQAGNTLEQLVLHSITDGGIFLVLLGLACAVLAVALLILYLVRASLIVLFVCAAPLMLLGHGLPQTEGMARLWWRVMLALLGVQVAQAITPRRRSPHLLRLRRAQRPRPGNRREPYRPTARAVPVLGAAADSVLGEGAGRLAALLIEYGPDGKDLRHLPGHQGRGRGCAVNPSRIRLPADVEMEDRLAWGLTARQLVILAVTALVCYGVFAAASSALPIPVAAALAAPLALAGVALALGRRDGLSGDRLALAAARHLTQSPRRVAVPDGLPAVLANAPAQPGVSLLRVPVSAILASGVVELADGTSALLLAASGTSWALRSQEEQAALAEAYGKWLNSLVEPTAITVRSEAVDLTERASAIERAAPGLPHPALRALRSHLRAVSLRACESRERVCAAVKSCSC